MLYFVLLTYLTLVYCIIGNVHAEWAYSQGQGPLYCVSQTSGKRSCRMGLQSGVGAPVLCVSETFTPNGVFMRYTNVPTYTKLAIEGMFLATEPLFKRDGTALCRGAQVPGCRAGDPALGERGPQSRERPAARRRAPQGAPVFPGCYHAYRMSRRDVRETLTPNGQT